jgi:hypothetical protein
MISFDTNILVYATAPVPDAKALRAAPQRMLPQEKIQFHARLRGTHSVAIRSSVACHRPKKRYRKPRHPGLSSVAASSNRNQCTLEPMGHA